MFAPATRGVRGAWPPLAELGPSLLGRFAVVAAQGMKLPDFAVPVLNVFQPAFSTPTYHRFLVLWLGAILTTGRQTITNILRTVRHHAKGHVSSYHRVF
jgi:hypothetical protein